MADLTLATTSEDLQAEFDAMGVELMASHMNLLFKALTSVKQLIKTMAHKDKQLLTVNKQLTFDK